MIKQLRNLIAAVKILHNWPIRLLEYFNLYPGEKIKYKLRNGLVFNVRKNRGDTFYLLNYCFRKPVYDKFHKIGLHDTVIDIGASFGCFSIYAANLARYGRVYAFEPDEENFKLLKENVRANNLSNIKAFKLGIADKKKKSKLFLSSAPDQHSIYITKISTGKYILPKFASLKDVFENNNISCCDFLKMNCEGAEFTILFSAPKKILKKIKYIAMQFHNFNPKHTHLQLKQYLEKNGFDTIISDEDKESKTGMLYANRINK